MNNSGLCIDDVHLSVNIWTLG